ncbi:hypothetical protein Tco_0696617 [Tanacetum coccineum]
MSRKPSSSWQEVECVGELQIVKENHDFIGTIPISYNTTISSSNSALIVPSSHPLPPPPEGAPMYRVIPTETNLKTLPVIRPTDDNNVLPTVAAAAANTRGHTLVDESSDSDSFPKSYTLSYQE